MMMSLSSRQPRCVYVCVLLVWGASVYTGAERSGQFGVATDGDEFGVVAKAKGGSDSRISIPFGQAWKWHLGDSPDGPGFGSGSLRGFKNRSSCTNMRERPEWQPANDKSAGQPYTSCGIACSYDPECVAYTAPIGNWRCYHGFNDTVCTGDGDAFLERGDTRIQRNFLFAAPNFDDSTWSNATLPHDPLINQTFNESAGPGAAFLPRQVIWYRKKFSIPSTFKGQHIFVYFQGVFQYSEIFLNGVHVQDHSTGYTSFTVRLDNASNIYFGSNSTNIIAIRADPSFGSGHWYEAGGINRPISLVITPMLHFVHGGVFPNPNSDGSQLRVSVEFEDLATCPTLQQEHVVYLTLVDRSGIVVATSNESLTGSGTIILIPTQNLETWSPQTPVTYTLCARVGEDEVNVTTGVRFAEYGHKTSLNGKTIELQGFSHHPSFAGMGGMTSPRLALFLVQTTKALGVNFWRNSHNPYEDAVYEMLTQLGVMCWDENRNFGSSHTDEYHDMIKAHRQHVSVMLWGLCNEGMCGVENGQAAAAFLAVKNDLDPERPQTGNLVGGENYNFPYVDIIAESGSMELNEWHIENPAKPITAGEHGFGNNVLYDSRGDEDLALARLGTNVSETFSGKLVSSGSGWNNLKPKQTIPFLLSSHGLGMWAMMDYYGEAVMGWPTIIKSRGHLDVAGFPRSTAWWFRTNYLANDNVSLYQKPLVGGKWNVQIRALTPCLMFASTPTVEIFFDGKSHGIKNVSSDFGLVDLRSANNWPPPAGPTTANVTLVKQVSTSLCSIDQGSFGGYDGLLGMWVDKGCRGTFECDGQSVECACLGTQGYCSTRYNCTCIKGACTINASNVTVVGIDAMGNGVGSHTLLTAGTATKIELVVDVPSPITGTGSALVLDGQDIALIRGQLLDEHGVLSRNSDTNVTFRVVSGPIRIIGVGSGSIRNQQPVQGRTYETWRGLVRVVIQATMDCTGVYRDLAQIIDVEADPGTYSTRCPTEAAIIEARTASGLSAQVSIPLSGNPHDLPFEVAKRTQKLDSYTYFEDVQP